jgi:phage shock protein PspC (stress-responsive transcriptional regulator)
MNRRLYRSVADRRIGGVAAGTATYFDVDPSIARVLWLLLALFTGGVFVIVYLVFGPWFLSNRTRVWQAPPNRRANPTARPRNRHGSETDPSNRRQYDVRIAHFAHPDEDEAREDRESQGRHRRDDPLPPHRRSISRGRDATRRAG